MIVTEIKNIKVNHCIPDNPVMLRWLNTLGGWEHWLFGTTQTEGLNTSFEDYAVSNLNIETATSTSEKFISKAIDSLVLGADNLTRNQILGLKTILYSPKVEILKSASVPYIWHTVIVQSGSFNIFETYSNRGEIEFTIELPEIQIQNG